MMPAWHKTGTKPAKSAILGISFLLSGVCLQHPLVSKSKEMEKLCWQIITGNIYANTCVVLIINKPVYKVKGTVYNKLANDWFSPVYFLFDDQFS